MSFTKKRRLCASLLAAVIATGSVAAATSGASGGPTAAAAAEKRVNIAYLVEALANPYFQSRIAGMKAAAKRDNGTVKVFQAVFNPQKQVAQCQDALASGKYQAIVVSPIVGTTLRSCLVQAQRKKVPMIAVDGPFGTNYDSLKPQLPGASGIVMEPTTYTTRDQARYTVRACRGDSNCKVVRLTGAPGYGPDAFWNRSFARGIAGNSNIKVVAAQPANFDEATGEKVLGDILQSNPDVDVLVTLADQVTLGAERALARANLTGKVKIISAGASKEAFDRVCDGKWIASKNKAPRTMGAEAARMALRLARGIKGKTQVNPVTVTKFSSVDKTNCRKYKAQYATR